MAIEKWWILGVPHLLWLGKSVYNGNFRGLVTLTPVAERLVVKRGAVTTCFKELGQSRLGFVHPTFCMRGERSNPLRHHRDLYIYSSKIIPCSDNIIMSPSLFVMVTSLYCCSGNIIAWSRYNFISKFFFYEKVKSLHELVTSF